MILTRYALGNPVAALVAALMVMLFGLISLGRLPIQLTPEVERPEITITTGWRWRRPKKLSQRFSNRRKRPCAARRV